VVSIPLGTFGGVGRASRQGILVKGSNFLDALSRVTTVVFDKTGTLTRGEFAVQEVVPAKGFDPRRLLELAMLTGDSRCAAAAVARDLGVDAFHAELLPEDKVRLLEEIQSKAARGGKVAFVGDGINDAPVIARADVGVAMGALGADAAIETADVVLMTDSPAKLVEAVGIARRTRTIVWQNIVMALAIKLAFVVLGSMGLASMWEAVFADVGVTLAAIVNATRVLHGRPGV
jgi:Cd2+/Zn2+-exporting ATPase